ncbi:MAG: hypothetical protein M9962_08415 [Oligoflexia bacterium]|nr:hypothetical protein [Oligoflexia bacterium]
MAKIYLITTAIILMAMALIVFINKKNTSMRSCTMDSDCALARDTYCGTLTAIRIGKEKEWADFDLLERKRKEDSKEICQTTLHPWVNQYEAKCLNSQCDAKKKIAFQKN